MNKKLFPVIIVLALLGIGGYYLKTRTSTPTKPGIQTNKQTMNEATEFANAIESGKPTICTMTKGADTMEYFIKGKKMRINTTNNIADEKGAPKTTIGHMINDEKFFYTWEDTTKQGSKMSLVLPSTSPIASIAPVEAAPKFDSASDYDNLKNEGYAINCKAGSIDDTVFTPPSDVKFVDPTEMVKEFTIPNSNGQIDAKQLEELKKQFGMEE